MSSMKTGHGKNVIGISTTTSDSKTDVTSRHVFFHRQDHSSLIEQVGETIDIKENLK